MLCYVAFSCASYTTTSYVKISLPTWKVGKETQPWLKSTWSKVNNLGNTVFFPVQESIFMFPRSGIARFRAWNPVICIWNGTCAQRGKNTKCCKGLRNDSWDAWQNSQKHRDGYSRRDLDFPMDHGHCWVHLRFSCLSFHCLRANSHSPRDQQHRFIATCPIKKSPLFMAFTVINPNVYG